MTGADRAAPMPLRILAVGASLGLCLLLIRARIMGFEWGGVWMSVVTARRMAWAGYYDLAYLAGGTAGFLALLFFARRPAAQRLVYRLYVTAALGSLLFALVNVKAVEMLGRPLNYQWLYYSDFLRSLDARNAILSLFSWKLPVTAAAAGAAMLCLSWLLARLLAPVARHRTAPLAAGAGLALACLYLPLAQERIAGRGWKLAKLENPVVSFARSIVAAQRHPALFSMATPFSAEDFRSEASRPSTVPRPGTQGERPIRNVVVFVMESVPAEYLVAYGGAHAVTPELDAYRRRAALFRNVYAHSPATNNSMVSMLLSVYPWLSYRSLTEEYPGIALPSLSGELQARGYRTAFLNAADNRFQRGDDFLSHRGFDMVADHRSVPCERETFVGSSEGSPFLDGTDDECIVDAFTSWVRRAPEQPFFAVLWTMMTHYPYFTAGPETDFGVGDSTFNRYLNALRHGDRALGKLLRELERRRLLDSTLVVVVGDHGEAFGQHQQVTHASKVYEENVHVPLLLINPRLFSGEEYSTVGGLMDLAPTVMDILGLPSLAQWRGRSLFAEDRSERAYFFAPWSSFLFGYRDRQWKVIYDATTNRTEVYDLLADPRELTDRSEELPEIATAGRQRIAAWVQYQHGFMKELLVPEAR